MFWLVRRLDDFLDSDWVFFKRRTLRLWWQRRGLLVVTVSLLAYFTYNALTGDRGLFAYFERAEQLAELETELETVRSERLRLQHRVEALNPPVVDQDIVEEELYRHGYLKQDEYILYE